MTKETIGLIITGVACLIVLLPFLWGLVRGKRQSAFRLVWVIVTGVLSFLFAMFVAKIIIEVVKIEGKSIPEFLIEKIGESNESLRESMQDNAEIMAEVTNLVIEASLAVIRLVLFVVCFWLFKWLLYPVWKILANKFYSKKQVSKRQIKASDGTIVPKAPEKPRKKGVLMGGVYGLIMGLFVLIITFVPVSTINNLVMAVDTQTKTETEDGVITNMLGDNAKYLTVYQDSPVGKILITTKIDAVQTFLGSQLTTINVGGQRTSLAQEALDIAPLYQDAKKISSYDFQNLSQEDIKDIVPVAKKLSSKVLSSKFVQGIYDTFKDYVVDRMLDTEKDFFVKLPTFEDAEINQVVRDCFAQIKNVQLADISNDISNLLDAVSELNENSTVIVDLLKNDISFEKIRNDISVELAQNVNQKLSNISLMEKCFPIAFNPLAKKVVEKLPEVEYKGESIKIVWTDAQDVSTKILNQELDDILDELVAIIKGVSTDSTEFDATDAIKVTLQEKDYYINYDVTKNIGGIVDLVKSSKLVNTQTYNSTINYLQVYAKKTVEENLTDADYQNLVLAVNRIIDTISNEESFKTEFGYLGKALKVYKNADDKDIKTVLMAVDELMPTYIYSHNIGAGYNGNEDSKYVYDHINLFLQTELNNQLSGTVSFAEDDILTITKKLSKIQSYKAEYETLEDLIDFVKNVDDIKLTANMTTLGEHLDNIKSTSKLVDDETCKILIKDFVNDVTLPTEFDGIMIGELTLKQKLIENIQNISSYQFELSKIGSVLNTDFASISNLAGYGEIMDNLADSKVFEGTLNQIAKSQIDENDFENYAQVLTDIKSNLDKITNTFKTEFEYLDNFIDYVNTADINDLSQTKTYLAENLLDADGKSKSTLLDDKTLYDLILTSIDDFELDGISVDEIGNLKNNLKTQISADYESEISILSVVDALDNLKDYYDNNIKNSIEINASTTKQDFVDFGAKLDGLKSSQFAVVLNAGAVNDIGKYAVENIYNSIGDDPAIAQQKQAVRTTIDVVDWDSSVNYSSLLGKIADNLEIE